MYSSVLDDLHPLAFEPYLSELASLGAVPSPAVRLNGVAPEGYEQALRELGQRRPGPLALYIHVPFCPTRCNFCACNTNVTHDPSTIDAYLDSLEDELGLVTSHLGRGRMVHHLHLGGGTPNHLRDEHLTRLMEIVDDHFQVPDSALACIECNPRRTSPQQLELLRELGFCSLSLGVQDLSWEVQRSIGRVHSAAMIRDVCGMARAAGFHNISFDLIHGLPEQTEASLAATLQQVIAMGPDRIRCFSYRHTPADFPHQAAINPQALPGAAETLTLFLRVVKELTQAGYVWIGAECFVRPGDEWALAQAEGRLHRNGIGFTALDSVCQLAFGPHGNGEVDRLLVQNESDLDAWQRAVKAGHLPISWGHRLSDRDYRRRRAYEQLLCNLALPRSSLDALDEDLPTLERFAAQGMLEMDGDGLRVTPSGRFLLRSLCARLERSLNWDCRPW